MQIVITPSRVMTYQQEAACMARRVRVGGAACVTSQQEMHRAPLSPSLPAPTGGGGLLLQKRCASLLPPPEAAELLLSLVGMLWPPPALM